MSNAPHRADLEQFAAVVVSRLGFVLNPINAEQMGQVLQRRLDKTACKSLGDYLRRFEDPAFDGPELREIAQELTVAETYFFRHTEQFQALAEAVLPVRLQAAAARGGVRMLSAGCASGEEAYSLAATLLGLGDVGLRHPLVLGVDVNPRLLEKARHGRYSQWSLRGVSEATRLRHFHRLGAEYAVDDRLKALVGFEERNLLDDDASFWKPDFFDVIFCRNVLIYFSPAATNVLIARLTRSLAPGGFLFLGPSETLRGISQDFHLQHTHGAFYYQRRLPEDEHKPLAPARTLAKTGPVSPPVEPMPAGAPLPDRGLEEIRDLFRQERFHDVLSSIHALPLDAAADPDTLLLHAVVLANKGELLLAEQTCGQLLSRDEFRPGAHYLMAVCQERRGDLLSAAKHDQMAIYLDPAFAMPRLHLGLLTRRLGDLSTARRELTQALALLALEDAGRILLFGGGFGREALIRLGQAQLDRCGGDG